MADDQAAAAALKDIEGLELHELWSLAQSLGFDLGALLDHHPTIKRIRRNAADSHIYVGLPPLEIWSRECAVRIPANDVLEHIRHHQRQFHREHPKLDHRWATLFTPSHVDRGNPNGFGYKEAAQAEPRMWALIRTVVYELYRERFVWPGEDEVVEGLAELLNLFADEYGFPPYLADDDDAQWWVRAATGAEGSFIHCVNARGTDLLEGRQPTEDGFRYVVEAKAFHWCEAFYLTEQLRQAVVSLKFKGGDQDGGPDLRPVPNAS